MNRSEPPADPVHFARIGQGATFELVLDVDVPPLVDLTGSDLFLLTATRGQNVTSAVAAGVIECRRDRSGKDWFFRTPAMADVDGLPPADLERLVEELRKLLGDPNVTGVR